MIPQISNALSNGFTSKQVIDFLLNKFPQHSDKIKIALASGFSVDQVLKFLSKGKAQEEISQPTTEFEGTRKSEIQQRENINKGALAAGALAATSLAAPAGIAAIQRAVPQSSQLLQGLQRTLGMPQMPGTQPVQNQPQIVSQRSPVSNIATIIPQTGPTIQHEVISKNIGEILSRQNSKDKVDDLLKSGNGPKEIMAYFRKFNPKIEKYIEKESGIPFEKAIEEYAKTEQMQPKEQSAIEPAGQKLDEAKQTDRIIEPEKQSITKNETVATPQGIGEVREIRNGEALVEVDGKLHKVNEEELEAEPEEVKKSRIDVDLSKIPEDLRSAPLNEVYAPAHRKHVSVKYNSDVGKEKEKRYIFYKKDGSPVDENIISKLREGSQIPVTSGKNFWGGWNADTQDSRGTVAYHELSKLAQKFGEEDDPSKPYWYEEEEEIFTHGYTKESSKQLREMAKEFNEENKKRKKKRS